MDLYDDGTAWMKIYVNVLLSTNGILQFQELLNYSVYRAQQEFINPKLYVVPFIKVKKSGWASFDSIEPDGNMMINFWIER